ncbi:MAG: alpha/beta hydrolase [Dehalococcoidia bacterium]|nr:alpha/beta hydrolase [Dehalococcoidia bacterium]MCB9484924.1 alpha/beta hydrolase [Thermoflexaceae bacterium]
MPIPSDFLASSIDAETAAFNQRLEETLQATTPTHLIDPAETRRAREEGRGLFGPPVLDPAASVRNLPGRAGEVPVRILRPDTAPRGVYLDIHGGGWVLGRAHHGDPRNRQIVNNTGMAVVSVDYRLAPEDPYPAGPDDCEDAAAWLIANAATEFGTDKIIIGGGSAGAHLAAVTMLRLRDRHGYTGFLGANFVFGVFDIGQTPSSATWGERYLVLSTPIMRWFADCYAAGRDYRDPDVSPLYANLHGLPPALFTVGTMDPLLDDSLFMHARWQAAGNDGELAVYPGGVHGFTGMPTTLGKRANAHADAWLNARLG